MIDVMIDLETLGVSPDSAFISIGAVIFDPLTGETGDTFYRNIDWGSASENRNLDPETIKWWMGQGDEARAKILENNGILLSDALKEFTEYLPEKAKVWGNGSTFDISMLENAYGKNIPWKFWNVRDVRTVVELAYGIVDKNGIIRDGVHHNALDDAIYQAKFVSVMVKALREGK